MPRHIGSGPFGGCLGAGVLLLVRAAKRGENVEDVAKTAVVVFHEQHARDPLDRGQALAAPPSPYRQR
jgi:hypothetical protein